MNTSSSACDQLALDQKLKPSRAVLRLRFYLSLTIADCIALGLAFALSSIIVHGATLPPATIVAARVIVPLYIVIALVTGAISIQACLHPKQSVFSSYRALVFTFVVFVLLAFLLKVSSEFSRLMLGATFVSGFLILGVIRYVITIYATRILGGNPWDTVLICDGRPAINIPDSCTTILQTDDLLESLDRSPEMFDRLARSIGNADRVLVRCPPERRAAWSAVLRGLNVKGEIEASELRYLAPQELSYFGSEPTIVVAQGPLALRDRVLKRLIDLTVVGIALVVLTPLFLAIALAVRISSPGPVFFKQTRLGRQNQTFTMFKFRSMYVDTTDTNGVISASRNDDRITPVGNWLRRTSIDELPQLLNVLRGDMSIVGPRPHALSSTAADLLFWEINPHYWDRHAIKPGLTGLAQVRGFRGATVERSDLENRLTADMEYIQKWSLALDFSIILRTLMVLVHRNAY